MKTKKLIVVGNADAKIDRSSFVDSCQVVIRFNLCENYNISTGKKADILCVTNTGPPGKAFYENKLLSGLGFTGSIKEIWFTRPRRRLMGYLYLAIPGKKELFDYGKKIIKANQLDHKRILYLSRKFHRNLWKKLLQFGETDALSLSSGILTIEMIISDSRFQDFEKYILGFTHEGWHGHPWKLEKMLVEKYISIGLIKSLD